MQGKTLFSGAVDFKSPWLWFVSEIEDSYGNYVDVVDSSSFAKYYVDCALYGKLFEHMAISPVKDLQQIIKMPGEFYTDLDNGIRDRVELILIQTLGDELMGRIRRNELGYNYSATLLTNTSLIIDVVFNYKEYNECTQSQLPLTS